VKINVPKDFSVVTDDDLSALEAQVREAAGPLVARAQGEGDPLDKEETDTLVHLGDVVNKVKGERARRISEASAAAATTRKTADAVAVFADGAASAEGEGDEEAEDDDPAKKKTPAKDEGAEPGADTVTAGGKKVRVADAARNGKGRTPNVQGAETDAASEYSSQMVAAPNLPTLSAGNQFDSILDVAKAAESVFSSYPRGAGGQYIKTPIMFLKRNFDPKLRISERMDEQAATAVFDYAADLDRIGGGDALVAAAGWCAPSQIDYSLMELEGTDGYLDMPEVQISRGGIQFTTGPDFSTIFGGAGYWHQTEAQVQAATSKPCMVISCPSFTEKRLEVEGVCITGAFLQDRGYPEMVARFTRGALKAHSRKMNIFKINQVIAGSTLFDYTNVANLPVTATEFKDLSVVNRLLSILDIQAVDYRYKYRMDKNALLEVFFPYWLIAQVRADVSRRMSLGLAESQAVTEAMFSSWLSARNLRGQFIYDWLDAYNTTNTSTVGQTAGVYQLPTTVEAVLYAPGTWVAGVSDVVRLDTVYDSTNLALNQYTQLFTEEGILVAKRGFESRRIKTTIDPSGVLSATADLRTG
jgi:hypothetical protein